MVCFFHRRGEDPSKAYEETGTKGDADPFDVCEIGHRYGRRFGIEQVAAWPIADIG